MQSVIVVSVVALVASTLTFFSGFGLGTVLLPAFALFYPVEQAVALTAAVHFLNPPRRSRVVTHVREFSLGWEPSVAGIDAAGLGVGAAFCCPVLRARTFGSRVDPRDWRHIWQR